MITHTAKQAVTAEAKKLNISPSEYVETWARTLVKTEKKFVEE